MRPINVRFGLTRHNEPLVTIEESPLDGGGEEIKPQQLREIAALLVKIADESEALRLNPGELRRSYQAGE